MSYTVQPIPASQPCKCCDGNGVQQLVSGERIVCKACGGTGLWSVATAPQYPTATWIYGDTWSASPVIGRCARCGEGLTSDHVCHTFVDQTPIKITLPPIT